MTGTSSNRIVAYMLGKVNPDGTTARGEMRKEIAGNLHWSDPQFIAAGILQETRDLLKQYEGDKAGLARAIPEAWIDQFSAAGTPEQVAAGIMRLAEAGAECVILEPIHNDPGALDEYIRYLMPVLKA
jgi:alkanesulfonate monooxygenase SsuD/methylene tetrahydromethanopterin reductase-like flavin-dependent oxidoreductase (luciferase family)